MESIWKTVLTFAVILLITAAGVTVTWANVDITVAGNYMETLSAVIRESNYSEKIISQCQKEAEENGYVLEVQVYENPAYSVSRYARLCLYYQYRLGLLRVFDWKSMERII